MGGWGQAAAAAGETSGARPTRLTRLGGEWAPWLALCLTSTHPGPHRDSTPPIPQTAQTELSKAAQDFRRLHAERAELLAQWEGVLEAIRKRDAAILEAGECGWQQWCVRWQRGCRVGGL